MAIKEFNSNTMLILKLPLLLKCQVGNAVNLIINLPKND